jgi:hypothetical protein
MMNKEFRKQGGTEKTPDELRRAISTRHESATSSLSPIEPQRAGASFFFEVKGGWEVRALADDENVRKVYTTTGLEDAFHDQTVRTILVPRDASITKNVVLRVCSRHGHGKTVFFEVATA